MGPGEGKPFQLSVYQRVSPLVMTSGFYKVWELCQVSEATEPSQLYNTGWYIT